MMTVDMVAAAATMTVTAVMTVGVALGVATGHTNRAMRTVVGPTGETAAMMSAGVAMTTTMTEGTAMTTAKAGWMRGGAVQMTRAGAMTIENAEVTETCLPPLVATAQVPHHARAQVMTMVGCGKTRWILRLSGQPCERLRQMSSEVMIAAARLTRQGAASMANIFCRFPPSFAVICRIDKCVPFFDLPLCHTIGLAMQKTSSASEVCSITSSTFISLCC